MRHLIFLFLGLFFFSCDEKSVTTFSELEGSWNFVGYESGYLDCPIDSVYLNITKGDKEYKVEGRAFVNLFHSTVDIGEGKSFKFGTIGSTKMAGPPELMECETAFFEQLKHISIYKLNGNRLHLTYKAKPEQSSIPPVLIFERK
ncbi:META domain-containing protein [Leadbetterella byssophila]|uniref:META domain-containing protein n=1 Tax=Leadbetterella byssophila TaxID=316068 RepID=UPI00399FB8BC